MSENQEEMNEPHRMHSASYPTSLQAKKQSHSPLGPNRTTNLIESIPNSIPYPLPQKEDDQHLPSPPPPRLHSDRADLSFPPSPSKLLRGRLAFLLKLSLEMYELRRGRPGQSQSQLTHKRVEEGREQREKDNAPPSSSPPSSSPDLPAVLQRVYYPAPKRKTPESAFLPPRPPPLASFVGLTSPPR